MSENRNKITSKQLASFIISSQIGLGILTLPSTLAKKVGHDGWICVILSGLAILAVVITLVLLVKSFPEKSILEIYILLYGKFLGILLDILFIVYLIFSASISTRIFSELINMIVLRQTPILITAIFIISPTLYFTSKGLKVICRFANLLFLAHFLMLLTFTFIIKQTRITYILPIAQSGIFELIKNLPNSAYSFLGFELLALFYTNVDKKNNVMKHLIYGTIYVTIYFTIITVFPVLLFGEMKLKQLVFPIFNVEQAIRVPVLERLDLFFIIFWFPTMASSIRTYFFSSYYCFTKMFQIKRKNVVIAAIAAITFIVSRIPDSFQSLYYYMDYASYMGIAHVFIMLASYPVSLIRKRQVRVE